MVGGKPAQVLITPPIFRLSRALFPLRVTKALHVFLDALKASDTLHIAVPFSLLWVVENEFYGIVVPGLGQPGRPSSFFRISARVLVYPRLGSTQRLRSLGQKIAPVAMLVFASVTFPRLTPTVPPRPMDGAPFRVLR